MIKSLFFLLTQIVLLVALLNHYAHAQIQLQDLKTVINVLHNEFGPELQQKNERLFINNPPPNADPNFWWNLDTVHASYGSYYEGDVRHHYLFLMGGYARLPGMTVDGVVATICHELGHGAGGAPFKRRDERAQVSTEGQSDYFAYRYCLPRVLEKLPAQQPVKPVNAHTDQLCQSAYPDESGYQYCTRAFQILEVEKMYFKKTTGQEPQYETPDTTVVDEVELEETFYPSPQCRLDTMMAGILKQPRPACWFR